MSPAVERAINIARQLSRRNQCGHTRPGHALAALLLEAEGKVSVQLAAAGVAREAVLSLFQLDLTPDSENQVGGVAHPIGTELEYALTKARSLTVELTGERAVTSEFLLLTLLDVDKELARTLVNLGLKRGELELAIRGDLDVPLPVEELVIRDPTDWSDAARILDANATGRVKVCASSRITAASYSTIAYCWKKPNTSDTP